MALQLRCRRKMSFLRYLAWRTGTMPGHWYLESLYIGKGFYAASVKDHRAICLFGYDDWDKQSIYKF